ncbi:DoxX family protein [Pseudidiomarina sediminum]|uniref:DoxX family protein n=1 Tax=Pseudidiomarina sediminum TaxID=431675 RepID=A0A432Z7P0_9GAMM|nr:DoxX family protein [Pseudidiomarina sediminum]RUO73855.1 DoxX family protein [Pseudidiomarina sediminum]
MFISRASISAQLRKFDFLGPLAVRLYLAPIFILAGWHKLTALEATASYFGDYLGLPAPFAMAVLAGATEFIGGIALLLGLALRWMAIPLMVTMVVAAATAHWQYGWHALPEATLTVPWEWRTDLIAEAATRKEVIRDILREHGNYAWLTEAGPVTILKNGIEFAATYFVMLLILMTTGAGRFVSFDYWIIKAFGSRQ